MDALITYDIDKKHIEVKSAMISRGYAKSWTSNGTIYHLPNTTLWKNGVTPSTAISDLKNVIQSINAQAQANDQIRFERGVAVEFTSWAGVPGDPN